MRYYSIQREKDFERLFAKGRLLKGKLIHIWYCENPEPLQKTNAGAGLAISISRKVSAKAVDRNLWKRRIREAVRSSQTAPADDAMFLVKGRSLNAVPRYVDLKKEIEELLKTAVKEPQN